MTADLTGDEDAAQRHAERAEGLALDEVRSLGMVDEALGLPDV